MTNSNTFNRLYNDIMLEEGRVGKAIAGAAIGASLLGSPLPSQAIGDRPDSVASMSYQQDAVRNQFVKDLTRHEGSKTYQRVKGMYRKGKFWPYKDSKGYMTIGYGHKILPTENFDNGINEDQAERMLKNDSEQAWAQAHKLMDKYNVTPNDTLSRVLSNMTFQMGELGVRKFKKMWAHLEDQNYTGAANEMLDSKWARTDSPGRAKELSNIVRSLR